MDSKLLTMNIVATLERLHSEARGNRWLWRFTWFNRLALAAGFIPSGLVKIMGERFTSLSVNHPMGFYLEALHHTGYYYPFIGVMQVSAAILLLIPRTATLGAILYFPIILNICILSLAVRFDGSLLSSPLMVLANLYLLCWDYDKLKFMLPFKETGIGTLRPRQQTSDKFPLSFFAGVAGTALFVVMMILIGFTVKPRNTIKDCRQQFIGGNRTIAGYQFCDCIHKYGHPLDSSLEQYFNAPNDNLAPYLEPLLPFAFYFEY